MEIYVINLFLYYLENRSLINLYNELEIQVQDKYDTALRKVDFKCNYTVCDFQVLRNVYFLKLYKK